MYSFRGDIYIQVNVHGDTNVKSIQIRVVNSDTGEIIKESMK
jgi:hypothetical protein